MRKTLDALMVSSALILTPLAVAGTALAASGDNMSKKHVAGEVKFTSKQQLGEKLANNLIGQNVKNLNDTVIGDINNLVITNDNKVSVAVIGVGGFLGIGEKNVAIQFKDLQISINQDGTHNIKVDTTKEILQRAPEYKKLSQR